VLAVWFMMQSSPGVSGGEMWLKWCVFSASRQ